MKFGTDGVRGRAYDELRLADATALAVAVARVLPSAAVVVGRDTRRSGPDFVSALADGFIAHGVDVIDLGVAPTPAVASVARTDHIPGIVVSASHNPWADNGLKVFAPGGRKLDDATQHALEVLLAGDRPGAADAASAADAAGRSAGRCIDGSSRLAGYAEAVAATVDGRRLDGLHVVLDTANGAASTIAPAVVAGLGADVVALHDTPDGCNINEGCGSTHPGSLADAVVARGADLGLAFDGDADRVLAVDAAGRLIDGDQIIAICADDLRARGRLADDTVVVTVMTNLGFRLAMAARGITVHETPVGDRHVLAALDRHGWSLGGEQSGHVIFHDLATTGDGLLTGLQLLDVVARRGPLGELADQAMERLPQVLENVALTGDAGTAVAAIAANIAAEEAALGAEGRVLVRASGTEPLVRVMVEATTLDRARASAERLVSALTDRS